ncbi:V-type ATP synthase subunit F [Methanotorris formicicus]|uniref:A-type ATP synthase subunit F n=1 Tax=Methanotorris formicicus Mc-S-70 TaxID=647171 RepID=H1KWT6_9EURY|nr:V-type ATP synthase subunit F [Methanotorris formicicus]EHP89069.1 Vacuolar H+transporting two-sector ATPase F subunit [Methanotorris formicicus Mc-S-70]
MKIGVVGDRDTAIGFRLAGLVDVYEVNNKEEAEKAIKELSEREDIGLIITTERIGEEIRDVIDSIDKVVVEIPDKNGPIVREHDPIRILVRKAVGVEMK